MTVTKFTELLISRYRSKTKSSYESLIGRLFILKIEHEHVAISFPRKYDSQSNKSENDFFLYDVDEIIFFEKSGSCAIGIKKYNPRAA